MLKQKLTLDVAAYYHKNNGICGFTYANELLCIGSCFAQNMGDLLVEHKFKATVNPYGIAFNPLVIAQQLNNALYNIPLHDDDVLAFDNLYFSYQAHSSVYGTTKTELQNTLQNTQANLLQQLTTSHYLILTFGSAYYYTRSADGAIVSNCHKQPQHLFNKEFSTTAQIVNVYQPLINALRELNNGLQILFTVSPVRYIRDGMVENNYSKAQLISAVHELIACNENVFYFPAYELIMDDLRDYRYFATDKVHPTTEAVQYVWEVFMANFLSKHDVVLYQNIVQLLAAARHRTLHPKSISSKAFKQLNFDKCMQLIQEYPTISFTNELACFSVE
jgi:lysophospholipase L1-like esterase